MDYTHQLAPDQAEQLRHQIIDDAVLPSIERVFAAVPEVNSAVMMVSQMWCDEALDAVHDSVRFSADVDPDLDAFMTWSRNQSDDWDDQSWQRLEYLLDPNSLVSDEVVTRIVTALRDRGKDPWWDANGAAIPAFAAFCEEGAHQEMPPGEAELPYAIFRRSRDGAIAIEVVGEMIRPEQNGVPPEGMLDVDMSPEPSASTPAPPPTAASSKPPQRQKGLLGRFLDRLR